MKRLFVVALLPFLASCGIIEPTIKRESKLARLDLQMPQNEVVSILGKPNRVRAAGERQDGKLVKLWEYEIYGNYRALGNALLCPFSLFATCVLDGDGTPYWLQFVDGKLERWGKAGDWQSTQFFDVRVREEKSLKETPGPSTNPGPNTVPR